ncbi:vWA domain-containing protein [Paenibacillus aceris]|uniref:VWA domain-containing protein n=1 Tax=Paenibacillus aceris TaxID=869555 RepID=A0ABS4HSA0_9BACL|nr:VWA domain-containing protein [Paenibacillus aceris]MBP1961425.1 hypothetical protein [Paenibacillus aceris]NHW37796.1 VWA domain-containing protein [Paenibacillus aceris]
MHFATLSGLWFSLSIPFILLLYMLKRRYIDTEISSHMLWRRILREQEANQPWQRLKRQLLLLLQLLAASLLVLALMQPLIREQQTAKSHIFFVLDASASMQTTTHQGLTRLEQAKQGILSYVKEEAPNRTYSLMVIKDQPELILQKESDVSALRGALDKVAPFYGKTNVQESLSLASALTREESDGEVRIYTDRQWAEKADEIIFSVPVQVVSVQGSVEAALPPEDAAINVSISQFGVKNNETDVRAVAVLKNWSTVNTVVETKLFADTQIVRTDSVQLKAGEQKSIFMEKLASANVYKLQLVTKDALEADNTSYAFPEGTGRTQIAYVGEGNLFLQKALLLAKADVLHIQKSKDGIYPAPIGQAPDLILLDGVDESSLKTNGWQKILVSKPVWRFASSAESTKAMVPKAPFTIEEHPVMRYIRLQDVNVAHVQIRVALPWEKAIVSSDGVPLLLAGTEEGAARLSFTFPLEQSDLALRTEFPILVQNAVAWLTQHQGGNLGRATAGERIDMPLHTQAAKAVWTADKEGASEEQAERNGKGLAARQTVPNLPGLYMFKEFDEEGRELQARLLEVVMDARESDVNTFNASKLSFKPISEQTLQNKGNDPSVGFTSLMPWLVMILLMLLVIEWEVYRRGHSV